MESSGISLPLTMDKLRDFIIRDCTVSEIKTGMICSNVSKTVSPLQNPRNTCFLSLTIVRIRGCECLKELTFLMFAPNIKVLTVGFVNQLEDIINKEKACGGEASGIIPFPRLINLTLDILPKLKNIYWRPLPLPCLKQIDVHKCPNLKKLPFDSHSGAHGEKGLVIRYREKEWIEGVEWEDQATETHFLSSCKKI
ncbi:hypothetical protein AALP_AA2G014300 [Arabis alpina]|uniref:Disease resistance protein At4g27190-like leucine-rich repeats domain-containing protein n=1 Tax=Arabis alpina TaxID=50452 RepID=A0A087HEM5_ARAAL|nr:hypothetical protein AALP_AA2G014300 [Arabis alpina]